MLRSVVLTISKSSFICKRPFHDHGAKGRTMSDIQTTFRDRLPWHGYATDNPQYGVRVYPKIELLLRSIIEYNARHSVGFLVYDVDSTTAQFDWYDRMCAPPNMIAINKENEHGHYFYGLITPVHFYNGASDAARRYLGAVDVAMTEELGADPGYSKLLSKNPLHDRWDVIYPREALYTLDELASWVDMDKYRDRRRRLPAVGLGRNDTLFITLRKWSYSARRREAFLSEEMFRDVVLQHGLGINAEFQPPLPHSEVRATAKSISRWVWRKMSDEGFIAYQKSVSAIAGRKRHDKAMELRESIIKTREQCPDLTQEDIAALHGVTQQCVSKHLR